VPKRRQQITTILCVIWQKRADLIYFAAEGWNRAIEVLFMNIFNGTLLRFRCVEGYAMWVISEVLNNVVTAFSNVWQDKRFLNNCIEQSHSWESNRCSASQEISGTSLNSENSIPHSHAPVTCPEQKPKDQQIWDLVMFRNTISCCHEKVLPTHPTPMLEEHSLSAALYIPCIHPQLEVAQCCFDIDLHEISNTDRTLILMYEKWMAFSRSFWILPSCFILNSYFRIRHLSGRSYSLS